LPAIPGDLDLPVPPPEKIRIRFALALLSLAAALLSTSGCQSDRYVKLDYDLYRRKAAIPQGITVSVGAFTDARPSDRLGSIVRDDQIKASVYTSNDPAEWVRQALITELFAAGFDVIDEYEQAEKDAKNRKSRRKKSRLDQTGPPPSDFDYRLAGAVITTSAEMDEVVSARVSIFVTASAQGATFLEKTYAAAGGILHAIGFSHEFNDALNQTLSKALARLIMDLHIHRPQPPSH